MSISAGSKSIKLRRATRSFARLKEKVDWRAFNFQSRVWRNLENESKLIDDYAR